MNNPNENSKTEKCYVFKTLLTLGMLATCQVVPAQEIPRGFVFPIEVGQGFRSVSSVKNQFYLASLRAEPMYSVLNNVVRVGAATSVMYTNPTVDLFGGPRVSVRLFQMNVGKLGSLLTVQTCLEALWGTRERKLWSGGVVVEIDPLLVFTVRGMNEYEHKEFWFEATVGFNLDVLFSSQNADL